MSSPIPPRPIRQTNLGLGRETLADRERRLQRLDELLARLSAKRRGLRGRPDRDGFTLIELLVVLTVILILVGMALPGLGENMRRSTVREAAGNILSASEQARQLALQANGIGEEAFGVRITDNGSDVPTVALLRYDQGRIEVLADDRGEPVFERRLPSAVVIWTGGEDLRSQSDGTLEWWYANGSGRLLLRDGTSFAAGAASVGLPARPVQEVWGIAANSGTPPAIAQGQIDHPGLAVRSSDGRYGMAIGIYPAGLPSSSEIAEDL